MNRFRIILFVVVSCLASVGLMAQDGVSIGNWRTHLPYRKVIDVEIVGNKIYAATDYELFYYDTEDNSINILNKVNGLSDIGISTIRFNQSQRKLFVAYTNTNIDLIDMRGNIKNMSDIKDKNILGNKTINNVCFDGDLAYVACGFGIVVFDLKREEVKDTYYIGGQGSAVNVTDIALFNGRIYASTNNGLYYASLNAPNLANYEAWHIDNSLIHPHLPYTEVEVFDGKLLLNYDGGSKNDTIFVNDGNTWGYFDKQNILKKREMRAYDDRLVLTSYDNVEVFDKNYQRIVLFFNPSTSILPWSAAYDGVGTYWYGDTYHGLRKTVDGWNSEDILPNGPASKNVFRLNACGNQVWISSGGYDSSWWLRYIHDGVARYDGMWTIFDKSNLDGLSKFATDFICTATDPRNTNVTYVGTWGKGLLKIQDDRLTEIYTPENSTLEHWIKDDTLTNISGLGFDSKGNLWVANTGANNLLSVMEPNGNWHSYNLGGDLSGIDIADLLIDKNDYKWIIRRYGQEIIVFNDRGTLNNVEDDAIFLLNTEADHGKLPGAVNSFTVDADGHVWLGTSNGPCYFSDSRKFFQSTNPNEYMAKQPMVDRNDGTGQADALFEGANVLTMAADGGNNMWFCLETGAYLMKDPLSNNPTQLHYFNTDNSPLLDNSVNTMAINKDGEVFFGTNNGVISYKGESAEPEPFATHIVAYPNPVRPDFDGLVGIKGLVDETLVRITTVDGNFVTQLLSEGGQAVWDRTDVNGHKVGPGIYLIFVSTRMGESRLATKLLIMN